MAIQSQGWSDTDNDSSIRISSIFHFNTTFDPIKPNTFILTSDRVLFVVHYRWLFAQSANLFGGTLVESAQPTSEHPLVINLSESSDSINILLHAVYGLPCESSMPTFQCLEETFQLLIKYGLLPTQRYISRGFPLFNAFLAQARTMPVEVFAFAASHRLEDLAVQSSAHTLDHPISDFSFETATQIGTRYMYRLYNLHAMRISRLKELLDMHPQVPLHLDPNLPANECSSLAEDHTQVVTRAYQLAATQVFYSASPGKCLYSQPL